MKRKNYERPTMKVFEVKQTGMLMMSDPVLQSRGASVDDYEDGEFTW